MPVHFTFSSEAIIRSRLHAIHKVTHSPEYQSPSYQSPIQESYQSPSEYKWYTHVLCFMMLYIT
jgi:hypothetical protein